MTYIETFAYQDPHHRLVSQNVGSIIATCNILSQDVTRCYAQQPVVTVMYELLSSIDYSYIYAIILSSGIKFRRA